ncbi:uncharacterized protein LOC142783726 [Rhipicephalus microplus]|uniref:uncharacterized protein LOC142783726 n=1 Tax=Rhipicephalus microplus TaxID=6941 RepID=UPI003F6AC9D9
MDIVHPSYITVDDFTGEVAWIKHVVEENSVCLLMAKVTITGPFGKLVTEAAASTSLSLQYPYIFSNRLDRTLCERGQKLREGTVQALTRSKAREIASRALEKTIPMETDPGSGHQSGAQGELATDQQNEVSPTNINGKPADWQREALSADETGSVLSLALKNFDRLVQVNRQSLAAEQDSGDSLAKLQFSAKEGIARGNVTLHKKGGLLYRHYRDKSGRVLDQLVVPRKYREDLLNLCHGNGWSGHLGISKTKARLLMEYYWPGCFKEVEEFVRSCDTCQRTGSSVTEPSECFASVIRKQPFPRTSFTSTPVAVPNSSCSLLGRLMLSVYSPAIVIRVPAGGSLYHRDERGMIRLLFQVGREREYFASFYQREQEVRKVHQVYSTSC